MSLKTNIVVNYISQLYVTIIGFVMLPVYIKYIGSEAYGLVGFYAMLQSCFNLLDMGLTPTIARETARFRGRATDAFAYGSLVRVLEIIFLTIALLGGCVLFLSSGFIAHDWLNVMKLPILEVENSLKMMAAIVAFRWMGGVYRGIISGSERIVWLGVYSSSMATLHFIGVLFVLFFIGVTPTIFFGYQLAVSILEFLILFIQAKHLLPKDCSMGHAFCSWDSLKPTLKFSLSVAFPSIVWVIVTQADKLLLSRILPLADYGHFTLAVLLASSVLMVSEPISAAIMPRMTKLEAEGDHLGLIYVYRQATQLVSVLAGAVSISVAFCAKSILLVWTGDEALASQAAPVLMLYVLGNGILAVAAFPYYLQYAKGNLRLHIIGNIGFVALLIPSIIFAANKYGAIGAGCVWLGMNALSFVAWIPWVHNKFIPGLNLKWYGRDVLIIYFVIFIVSCLLNLILPPASDRWQQIGFFLIYGGGAICAGLSVSSVFWINLDAIKKRFFIRINTQ